MESRVLFVYGSLKRGHRNHRLLADQQYLGEAVTEPRYRLVDLGTYAGMVRDDAGGLAVRGELWAVEACALAELDDFEGGHGEYVREPVAVRGSAGPVDAYLWTGPVPPGAASGDVWPFPTGEG